MNNRKLITLLYNQLQQQGTYGLHEEYSRNLEQTIISITEQQYLEELTDDISIGAVVARVMTEATTEFEDEDQDNLGVFAPLISEQKMKQFLKDVGIYWTRRDKYYTLHRLADEKLLEFSIAPSSNSLEVIPGEYIIINGHDLVHKIIANVSDRTHQGLLIFNMKERIAGFAHIDEYQEIEPTAQKIMQLLSEYVNDKISIGYTNPRYQHIIQRLEKTYEGQVNKIVRLKKSFQFDVRNKRLGKYERPLDESYEKRVQRYLHRRENNITKIYLTYASGQNTSDTFFEMKPASGEQQITEHF